MEPPPREESPPTEPPPRERELSEVTRVVNEITSDWLTRHFASYVDAIDAPQNLPPNFQFPQGSPQLFQYRPVPEENYQHWPWPLNVQYGPVAQDLHRHPPWPLHFESEIMINNWPYLLQLEKVPFAYICQKLTLLCMGISDPGILVDDHLVDFSFGSVCEVYRVVVRVSEDYQSLISYERTRVGSRHI